jgi:hypothetical protein
MLSFMGRVRQQKIEHYSHILMTARREAVEALSITVKTKKSPDGHVRESLEAAAWEVIPEGHQ